MRRNRVDVQDETPPPPTGLAVIPVDSDLYKRLHLHKEPLPCELILELAGRKLYIAHYNPGNVRLPIAGGVLRWEIPILTIEAANWLLEEATAFAKGVLEEIRGAGFSWTFSLQADLMVAEIRDLCAGPWRDDQVVRMP